MRKVYNQKNLSLIIDGVQIMDFAEGATFVYTFDGGEVQKTQGTDGCLYQPSWSAQHWRQDAGFHAVYPDHCQ